MKIKTKYLTILSYYENFEIFPPILLFLFFSEKSQESAGVKTLIMKLNQPGLRKITQVRKQWINRMQIYVKGHLLQAKLHVVQETRNQMRNFRGKPYPRNGTSRQPQNTKGTVERKW